MGKSQSKDAENRSEGPIVDNMRKKYGPECLIVLKDWTGNYGVSKGGSLSVELEGKLKGEEAKLIHRKKN